MTRHCVLGLTGEQLADFNMLMLGPDPDAESFLVRSVARARERGLPLIATMSPHVATALAPVAGRLGLAPVGTSPMMVLRRATPVRSSSGVRVQRALGPELVEAAGDLVAAAFDTPRDAVARCIDVGVTETAGIETYLGWTDAGAVGAVSVTPAGATGGITLMATRPDQQRKGVGRALLSQVIADYRARGMQRFYLGATEAGRPLYASLGFDVVADMSAWLLAIP
jgi:GNAT superfamily N-acetyltransferase